MFFRTWAALRSLDSADFRSKPNPPNPGIRFVLNSERILQSRRSEPQRSDPSFHFDLRHSHSGLHLNWHSFGCLDLLAGIAGWQSQIPAAQQIVVSQTAPTEGILLLSERHFDCSALIGSP